MSTGQIYFQVLECKDLWDEASTKGEKTPYVTVKVPDDKLKDFRKTKTKEYKDTSNSSPKFNEQFIVNVPNKGHPITLKIANEKIGANEELGEAVMSCQDLPDRAPTHLWLAVKRDPKSSKKVLTNGQIHVLVIFTPMPIAEKFSKRPLVRMPLFRLGLERQHYFAGEKMRGLVFLNVGKPYDLRGVRLFFEGIQHVWWQEQHGTGEHRHTVTYSKTVTIFSAMTTVFGIPQADLRKKVKESFKVESGQYAFPFEFTFPVNIPPTMRIDHSSTYYRVRGKIDRPKGKSKWISAPINLYIEYGSLKETSDIASKTKKYGKQPITVTALSTKEILYLGETATFVVDIKNESEKKVTNLKVTLMKLYTLHARGKTRSWKVHHLRTVIKDDKIFPVVPAQSRQLNVSIQIPDGLQPSLPPDISPIIHITYTVKIAADISGAFSGKVRAYIPLKIGWRHPPQLANIPLPLAPMGNPCEIRLMPQFVPPPMPIALPQEIQAELTQEQLQFAQMNMQQAFQVPQGQPAMQMNYMPAMPEAYDDGENQGEEEWSKWRQSQRVELPQGYTPVGPVYQGSPMVGRNAGGGMAPPPQGGFQQPPPQGGFQQPPPQGGFQQPPPQGGFQQPSPQGGFQQPPPGGYVPPGGYQPPPTSSGGFQQPPPSSSGGFPPPQQQLGQFQSSGGFPPPQQQPGGPPGQFQSSGGFPPPQNFQQPPPGGYQPPPQGQQPPMSPFQQGMMNMPQQPQQQPTNPLYANNTSAPGSAPGTPQMQHQQPGQQPPPGIVQSNSQRLPPARPGQNLPSQ